MSSRPPLGVYAWDLLRALVKAYEASPNSYNPAQGIGGEVFYYNHMDRGQFVRHPGLPGGEYEVRADHDIQTLVNLGYLFVLDQRGESYTFQITEAGFPAVDKIPQQKTPPR